MNDNDQIRQNILDKLPADEHWKTWATHTVRFTKLEVGYLKELLSPARGDGEEHKLTNAMWRMFNFGRVNNTINAKSEVQALGMFLRGHDIPAWETATPTPPGDGNTRPWQPPQEGVLTTIVKDIEPTPPSAEGEYVVVPE